MDDQNPYLAILILTIWKIQAKKIKWRKVFFDERTDTHFESFRFFILDSPKRLETIKSSRIKRLKDD